MTEHLTVLVLKTAAKINKSLHHFPFLLSSSFMAPPMMVVIID